jgi:hypothetical protein
MAAAIMARGLNSFFTSPLFTPVGFWLIVCVCQKVSNTKNVIRVQAVFLDLHNPREILFEVRAQKFMKTIALLSGFK